MIVIDNSVLVQAFVQSERTGAVQRLVATDARWIVPPLWQFEFTNALTTLVRGRTLAVEAAHDALADARAAVTGREVPVDQGVVLRLAVTLALSGYDAQYVALAREYGTKCVTADRQLARRAPDHAILLTDFLA